MNDRNGCGCIKIRTPRAEDIPGIRRVVADCAPYLTNYAEYLYFRDLHCNGQTTCVAELGGEVVGWCSIFPAPALAPGRFFLHQIGTASRARHHGIAEELFFYLLPKLAGLKVLQFTIDRKNTAAQKLFHRIAVRAGLRLLKTPGVIPLLEGDSDDELYVMTPDEADGSEVA